MRCSDATDVLLYHATILEVHLVVNKQGVKMRKSKNSYAKVIRRQCISNGV